MTGAEILLALVTAERLGELVLARRNTAALWRRGAVEVGAGHYPALVALHAAWIATLALLGHDRPLDPVFLAVFVGLQGARVAVLATLGRRWTTRILVLPGERLVRRGLYRFVDHPNYIVVIGEILVLPLVLGLPVVAGVFTVLNAVVLAVRVAAEDAALAEARRRT